MNRCGIGRMKNVFFVEDNREKFEKTCFFQTFSLLVPRFACSESSGDRKKSEKKSFFDIFHSLVPRFAFSESSGARKKSEK